jgi:hypothetical protein
LLASTKEIDLVDEGGRVVLSESIADGYDAQSMYSHVLFLVQIEPSFDMFYNHFRL